MPYFPKPVERAYRCPGCGGWFIPGYQSCLVAHPPGSCCHEYETPAQPPPALARDGVVAYSPAIPKADRW